jgi:hypothetical protein
MCRTHGVLGPSHTRQARRGWHACLHDACMTLHGTTRDGCRTVPVLAHAWPSSLSPCAPPGASASATRGHTGQLPRGCNARSERPPGHTPHQHGTRHERHGPSHARIITTTDTDTRLTLTPASQDQPDQPEQPEHEQDTSRTRTRAEHSDQDQDQPEQPEEPDQDPHASPAMLASLSLSIFVSAIYAAALLPLCAVVRLAAFGLGDVLGWSLLLVLAALAATPLEWMDGAWPRAAMAFIAGAAVDYFPMR